jgi:hypothetical protein
MAERIEAARKAGKTPTDRRMVQIERDLFIGCYSIRKLMHAPLFTVTSPWLSCEAGASRARRTCFKSWPMQSHVSIEGIVTQAYGPSSSSLALECWRAFSADARPEAMARFDSCLAGKSKTPEARFAQACS